ncbi:MAG TPA: PQQ-binding-like beta-propeller repeat protein [Candidatus Bathyarchaeia archaeon]|nr:PQQ-binding-like beta-propeller repeat protein [Candidatus Bathyarchaeia archaeon]
MNSKFSSLLVLSLLVSMCTVCFNFRPAKAGTSSQSGLVQAANTDWWSMFHHDPAHSGYSTSRATYTNQTLWTYMTGGGVYTSPAVAYGTVFVGSYDGNIYALNASTGAFMWRYTTDGGPADPAVSDGVVFVGSGEGYVYALNASTGSLIWIFATSGAGGVNVVLTAPTVTGGLVYLGSMNGYLYALNASTGTLVWSYEYGETGNWEGSSPAVEGGVVYVGSNDYYVYALNASTGELVWRSGKFPFGLTMSSSPAVVGGMVYVNMGSDYNYFYALNASTGAVVWWYVTHGAYSAPLLSSPAVVNGVVYVGSDDYHVYALNASTGAFLWTFATGGIVESSPAVAGGIVYVGSWDGRVYALDALTGALLWSYKTGGIESSPAVVNGVVYVGSDDDEVYAFSSQTYSVSFSESGLPSGTVWSVTFNGMTSRGSHSIVTFSGVKNGSYSYTVGSVPDYTASSSTGSVTVNGANASVLVTFTKAAPVGGVSVSVTTLSFLAPWLTIITLLATSVLLKGIITKKNRRAGF